MTQHKTEYPCSESTDDRVKDRPREMGHRHNATDQLTGAAESAKQLAGHAAEQLRAYSDKAQEAAKQFKPMVHKSLKDQPMATLALAAMVGFVLGALWKR